MAARELTTRIAPRSLRYLRISAFIIVLLAWAIAVRAQPSVSLPLKHLSLEQLIDVEITSVAKNEQKISAAAAAVYVITDEEIRRSGVTTIPEALRLVTVSRVDGNRWEIGIRGFGLGQNFVAEHHAECSGGTKNRRGICTKGTWRW